MSRRRFVLLDRDGTVIVERHYLSDPEGVELIAGAAAGLRQLAGLGLGLVVVTNQSAIGRGLIDADRLDRIHRRMLDVLAAEGVQLDGIYYCPHRPEEGCDCRKPRTGLVDRATAQLCFDARRSFVVGDAASDMELGRAIGATRVLVRTGYGAETQAAGAAVDHVVADLREAATLIEGLLQSPAGGMPSD
jgi:D-glycero-D-manno-heptose 1,7-bisphosphate phosphatase